MLRREEETLAKALRAQRKRRSDHFKEVHFGRFRDSGFLRSVLLTPPLRSGSRRASKPALRNQRRRASSNTSLRSQKRRASSNTSPAQPERALPSLHLPCAAGEVAREGA